MCVLTGAVAAIAALAFVCAPVVARTGSGKQGQANDKRAWVRVMDNFFDPRLVAVNPGTKVNFVWKGTNRHNVRFTKVPSGASRRGSKILIHGRWTRTFTVPGQYHYTCTLFAGMRGTITVKAPASGQSPER